MGTFNQQGANLPSLIPDARRESIGPAFQPTFEVFFLAGFLALVYDSLTSADGNAICRCYQQGASEVSNSFHEPSAKDTEAVHPKNAPTAKEIMTRRVHTVEPSMGLHDVTTFLLRHEISNAPVVQRKNDQQVLLGFISEADCLEFLANGVFYGEPSLPQTAETMMKKHPVCVGPDQDVFTLTSIFISHNYRHLPVVEGQNLLGIVSRRDVIRSLDQYYRQWISMRDRDRFPVDLHQIMNQRFLVSG